MSLKDEHLKNQKQKYPNVPEHALYSKRYSDKTANGLTSMILDYCKMNDIFANRISSEGRYRPGDEVVDVLGRRKQMKGTWLSGLNKGLPDIILIVDGKFVGIEVKIGNDRQSEIQKEMQERIERSGGVYLIIKTYNQFESWIKQSK